MCKKTAPEMHHNRDDGPTDDVQKPIRRTGGYLIFWIGGGGINCSPSGVDLRGSGDLWVVFSASRCLYGGREKIPE